MRYIFLIDLQDDKLESGNGIAKILNQQTKNIFVEKIIIVETVGIRNTFSRVLQANQALLVKGQEIVIVNNSSSSNLTPDLVIISDDTPIQGYIASLFTDDACVCFHNDAKEKFDHSKFNVKHSKVGQHQIGGLGYPLLGEVAMAYENNSFDNKKYGVALESIKTWFKSDREEEIRKAINSFNSKFCK